MFVRSVVTAVIAGGALVVSQALPAAAIVREVQNSASADGRIENAVQIGTKIYIGGSFTAVDGSTRTRLAALNAATGQLDPNFHVEVNGKVTSLTSAGTTLYIAGSFTTVGTVTRKNVAAINTVTGDVLSFKVAPSATVLSIDALNGRVYLGGSFQKVDRVAQPYVAAVDAVSGDLITSFKPKPSAAVSVVKATADGVYVGGSFQSINAVPRNYAAQLDGNGGVLLWDPDLLGGAGQVNDLTVGGGHVYLATGGGQPAGNSAYSISAAGAGAQEWQVHTDGNLQSVEVVNGVTYAGGHFNNIRTCNSTTCSDVDSRYKAAAIDATGHVLSWNPRFNSALGVWDLTAAGGNLYAFGDFTTVNRDPQAHIARFALP